MISPAFDRIARTIVETCHRVQRGEVIHLMGDVEAFPLLEALAFAIRRVGAHPVVEARSATLVRRMLNDLPLEILEEPPAHWIAWLDQIDGHIFVNQVYDQASLVGVRPEGYAAAQRALAPWRARRAELKRRWTLVSYPTRAAADLYSLPYEEYHDLIFEALDQDYQALAERARGLAAALAQGNEVHLWSRKGTDLRFSLAGRRPLVDDGIISDEDMARGDVGNNLPAGEVFIAPVETSAEGHAVFDLAFHRGTRITDLDLLFRGGRVVESTAASGVEVFRERVAGSTGDADQIAEFGVGINAEIRRLTGFVGTDEKMLGSIHIAIGDNHFYGGESRSSLHWDMVMMHPTVTIDGETIMREGELLV